MSPLPLATQKSRDRPHCMICTQGKEERTPQVHGAGSLYKVKIGGKSKWGPGQRGVRAREAGALLVSGTDPGPGPGPCNSWEQEHLGV